MTDDPHDLRDWWITEYEWHTEKNESFPKLVNNLAWLRAHGAHIVSEPVDGFNAPVFAEKEMQVHRNNVSTVVWGSPHTDVSSTGKSVPIPRDALTDAEWSRQFKDGKLDSNTVKAAIFRHLQNMFPYATVVVTCGRCDPTPSVSSFGHASVVLSTPVHVPMIGDTLYRPSFATGHARVEDNEAIRALVALPETLRPHLSTLFCPSTGNLDLYSLIALSAVENSHKGHKGATLFLGEECANLSRSAGEVAIARSLSNLSSTCANQQLPSSYFPVSSSATSDESDGPLSQSVERRMHEEREQRSGWKPQLRHLTPGQFLPLGVTST